MPLARGGEKIEHQRPIERGEDEPQRQQEDAKSPQPPRARLQPEQRERDRQRNHPEVLPGDGQRAARAEQRGAPARRRLGVKERREESQRKPGQQRRVFLHVMRQLVKLMVQPERRARDQRRNPARQRYAVSESATTASAMNAAETERPVSTTACS